MKEKIEGLICDALKRASQKGLLASGEDIKVEVDLPRVGSHGDFASNVALAGAKHFKMPPLKTAGIIADNLSDEKGILEKVEIAGPGFINFFLRPGAWYETVKDILLQGDRYGAAEIGLGRKVMVEFVSANPTGPLHIGHGRGAAVGDATARLLAFCGYDVSREYYINDSGKQIATLGRSVAFRIREFLGEKIQFPKECYQGEYIRDIARRVMLEKKDLDPDGMVEFCARYAADLILKEIRQDLEDFNVSFDCWFSEQSLFDSGKVEEAIENLKRRGVIFEKDGALWFASTAFGDEKDRVVVRGNGHTTYFASDIAYHIDKFDRGFERVIDVWGADHHGYVPRMKAAVEAVGHKGALEVILVQLVNLRKGGIPVAMSTRSGEFVPLKEVIDEVGSDAARFIFLSRHHESPLDFDIEVAKKKTDENPVFYVQYVHARICSILKKAEERGIDLAGLTSPSMEIKPEPGEIRLIKHLGLFPETVLSAASFCEPHRIAFFLMELASAFHSYYNRHRVLDKDPVVTRNRLILVSAVRQVIKNGLFLMGISAPQSM